MARPWLTTALRWQTAVSATVMAAFCTASLAGWPFGTGVQLGVLLCGVIVTGFPHGAFDHLIARPVLRLRLGRSWSPLFLGGYVGLAALVGAGWFAIPAFTLTAFLAASVVHFGLGDAEDGLAPARVPRSLAVLAYGALPLLLPMALHPAEAAPVLAALAGVPASVMEHDLHGAAWLLPPWAAAFAWVLVAAWRERRGVAERLVTLASFVLLPPLLAFGLYFALGHAVRHMLRLGAWHNPRDPVPAARWLAWTAAPAGLACAAGLAALALAGRDTTVTLLMPGFRIIAALTLPHMIVTSWLSASDGQTGELEGNGS